MRISKSSKYWQHRLKAAMIKLHAKNEAETIAELQKLYKKSYQKNITKISNLYNKMLLDSEAAGMPTNIYNLDKYYQLQQELIKDLRKLGVKEASLMEKRFIKHFNEIDALIDGLKILPKTLDRVSQIKTAQQVVLGVWCADGKDFSSRIWTDKARLIDSITQSMQDAVIRGVSHDELIKDIQKQFGTSFNNASRIVRTELTAVQNQAAVQRYKESGIKYCQVLTAHDDRVCEICKEYDGKVFEVDTMNTFCLHPNDRCTVTPVLSKEILERRQANV